MAWTEERRQAARERFLALKPWKYHKGTKGQKRNPFVIDAEQEAKFLTAYYAEDSETRGNRAASAVVAGYAESTAETNSGRILAKYDKKKFQEALKAVGINNLLMAYRLRKMITEGADKDAINAIRLALAAKGESTDQQPGSVNIQSTAPVMVIIGANASRINALRTAERQKTPAELEAEEDARVQERLDLLKKGALPLLPSKSKARSDEEEPLANIESPDDSWNLETGAKAG